MYANIYLFGVLMFYASRRYQSGAKKKIPREMNYQSGAKKKIPREMNYQAAGTCEVSQCLISCLAS
jgi:hypothetical protein